MHHCWSASRRERSQPRRCKTAKGLIGRLLPLTLVLLCGGCGLSLPSDHTLVVYVESEVLRDRRLAALSRQANRRIIEGLSDRFRLLRPDARVHIRFLPQERLLPVLRDRAPLGLGPDLVLSESTLARAIAAEGLSEPADLAAIQRGREIRGVHHFAAAAVEDDHAVFHGGDGFRAHHVASLRCEIGVE